MLFVITAATTTGEAKENVKSKREGVLLETYFVHPANNDAMGVQQTRRSTENEEARVGLMKEDIVRCIIRQGKQLLCVTSINLRDPLTSLTTMHATDLLLLCYLFFLVPLFLIRHSLLCPLSYNSLNLPLRVAKSVGRIMKC